jgi:hypothetical protein
MNLTELNKIYELKLDGDEQLDKKHTIRIQTLKLLADKRWDDLLNVVYDTESINDIVPWLKLDRPSDWDIGAYEKVNILVAEFSVPGYCKINTEFSFLNKKWNSIGTFSTTCLVCGEFRSKSLAEVLSYGWRHYLHL